MNILLSIYFFCVLRKKESHRFGMTWEWLNDRMFILGWTVPLRCVFVRGSLALWPEMSRVADTAKAMCLNSVAFERGGYVHKHTHNSLMLKRKQGTGGLNAYHNQTHGQCVCVFVRPSLVSVLILFYSPALLQPASAQKQTCFGNRSPLAARKTDRVWLVP